MEAKLNNLSWQKKICHNICHGLVHSKTVQTCRPPHSYTVKINWWDFFGKLMQKFFFQWQVPHKHILGPLRPLYPLRYQVLLTHHKISWVSWKVCQRGIFGSLVMLHYQKYILWNAPHICPILAITDSQGFDIDRYQFVRFFWWLVIMNDIIGEFIPIYTPLQWINNACCYVYTMGKISMVLATIFVFML